MAWHFHSHHGSNILLPSQRLRAERQPGNFDNSLLFSDAPIPIGETVSLLFKIEGERPAWHGGPRIGFTNQDPNCLDAASLPSAYDPGESLGDLSWAVILEQPSKGSLLVDYTVDELGCVTVQHAGKLKVLPTNGAVDFKRPVWAMIELCGFYYIVLIASGCPFMPSEIKPLGEEKTKLFLKAVEKGSRNVRRMPMIAVGETERSFESFNNIPRYDCSIYVTSTSTNTSTIHTVWSVSSHDWYIKCINQMFLPLGSVFLVCFNLCHDLDKPPVSSSSGNAQERMDEGDELTLWECMDHWIRAIHEAVGNSKPYSIVLVGTNKNRLSEDPAKRDTEEKRKIADLQKRMCKAPYYQRIFQVLTVKDEFIVSLHDVRDPDLDAALRTIVPNLPSSGQEIPQKWLDWESNLVQVRANFWSLQELRDKTSDITSTMEDGEFWLMVEYYHKAGRILCLDWLLKCPQRFALDPTDGGNSPSFFIKPVLLEVLFYALENPHKFDSDFPMAHERLRNEGILEERLLESILKSVWEFKKPLIDFLSRMDLLCVQRPALQSSPGAGHMGTSQGQGTSQRAYFMPEAVRKKVASCSHDPTTSTVFYVYFGSFLTDALFCHLVVRALAWSQRLEGTEPDQRIRFRQAFFPIDRDHEVHLQLPSLRHGHIKVCVTRLPVITKSASSPKLKIPQKPPSAQAACKVKDFIITALDEITSFRYHLGVSCHCTEGASLHFLPLTECLEKDLVFCSKKPGERISTNWIQEKFHSENVAVKGTCTYEYAMSEKHLSAIASRIGPEWEKLALILGLSKVDVDTIKLDNQHNNENARCSMLIKWSQRVKTQDAYEKADLLKSALEECGRKDLADQLLGL